MAIFEKTTKTESKTTTVKKSKTLNSAQKLALMDKYKKDVLFENDNGEFFFSKANARAAMVDKKKKPTEYTREGLTGKTTENA